MSDSITAPAEDYLKAIYDIERGGEPAATNDIAARLGIAAASVSGMIRRLADQGLIKHERYKGTRLTATGRKAALRTIRRHRVIEAYLARALGYPWDSVHEEAERLEHAASDELVDRMARAIGEPHIDPHGAPIPTREGDVDETPLRTLLDLKAGQRCRVVSVADEDADLLRYVAKLGLRPGTEVEIVDRAPFDGPISLRVRPNEAAVQIGPVLAGLMHVTAIAD
ncbi:MAG TPA: metal-dependent transcriptional regulator [Gemmatimonadaceae bacterium]|jgi:DtxR family Mn-dependent transcriptional regulator|nr:metal-dependent transcriptional regulator [Gemmatimonadaceae bacterium]